MKASNPETNEETSSQNEKEESSLISIIVKVSIGLFAFLVLINLTVMSYLH